MMRVICESDYRDISDFLISSVFVDEIVRNIPEIVNHPSDVESEVNQYVVRRVKDLYQDQSIRLEKVVVIRTDGYESDVVSSNHEVVLYNGTYYDYTAHQFSDSYNNLIGIKQIPIVQSKITNELQIDETVSSVKYYAMLGLN